MDRQLSDFGDSDDIYTVSEVTQRVKRLLDADPELSDIMVSGEISNFTHHSSGHMYFNLKDDNTTLRCVMFGRENQRLDFEPEEGLDVVAEGRISVYESRGEYQLYVKNMEERGEGELYRKFLELKDKLDSEGLFDDEKKKSLPNYPSTVGVVTSDSGAALHDIRDVISRRYPAELRLAPAKVQGDGASESIAESLELIDSTDVEVVIVGRGGGSMEDLWAFNEEVVARAIHECDTPVVSAVGHEVDVTISDLVADEKAATPSEAGEIVVPDADELLDRIENLGKRAKDVVERRIESYDTRLESYERFFERRPPALEEYVQNLDDAEKRLGEAIESRIEDKRNKLAQKSSVLDSLSPLGVLSRGYSVTESGGEVVKSVDDVSEGDDIDVRVSDGKIKGRVDEVEEQDWSAKDE